MPCLDPHTSQPGVITNKTAGIQEGANLLHSRNTPSVSNGSIFNPHASALVMTTWLAGNPCQPRSVGGLDVVLFAFGPFLRRSLFQVLNTRRSEVRAWPSAALTRNNVLQSNSQVEGKATHSVDPNVLSLFQRGANIRCQPANLPRFRHVPRSLLGVSNREAW